MTSKGASSASDARCQQAREWRKKDSSKVQKSGVIMIGHNGGEKKKNTKGKIDEDRRNIEKQYISDSLPAKGEKGNGKL